MATLRSELKTRAPARELWSAIRDIGALHTRLVLGVVTHKQPARTQLQQLKHLVVVAKFIQDACAKP